MMAGSPGTEAYRSQLIESVVVDSAIKMGLFKAINASSSSTIEELAKKCNAETLLTGSLASCRGNLSYRHRPPSPLSCSAQCD